MENQQTPNRRDFIKDSLSLGLLSIAHYTPFPSPLSLPNEVTEKIKTTPFRCPPYLQKPTPHSIVIQWINSFPMSSWVAYGEKKSLGMKAYPIRHGQVAPAQELIKIKIKQLKPNTRYYYKAFAQIPQKKQSKTSIISSELKSFRTPSILPENATVAIMNHTEDAQFPLHKDTQLVLFNGGLLRQAQSNHDIIRQFVQPAAQTLEGIIPFATSRAREELQTSALNEDFHRYVTNPQDRYYFVHQIEPLFLLVLDSSISDIQEAETEENSYIKETYMETQADWLEKMMRSPTYQQSTFKVVILSTPVNTINIYEQKLFYPLFDKYKIDLLITGGTTKKQFLTYLKTDRYPTLTTHTVLHPQTTTYLLADKKQLAIKIEGKKRKIIDVRHIKKDSLKRESSFI
ncbi:MAG TPA: fibronectin type III domain-containing protein [Chitinophagaceae bacterium]|nr:fibronectin type III domain-containing protein [Chitinophagaceae bacterium]